MEYTYISLYVHAELNKQVFQIIKFDFPVFFVEDAGFPLKTHSIVFFIENCGLSSFEYLLLFLISFPGYLPATLVEECSCLTQKKLQWITVKPPFEYCNQIQIQKNQAGAKFMVKYLNINFPLGSGSSGGGVRKVEFNPNKR